MNHTALFAGSFDPFTIGHDAIVRRALNLVDRLIIGVGVNKEKKYLFPIEQRLSSIMELYASCVTVISYDTLTVDFAREQNVDYIIRGVRNMADFEFEKNVARMNFELSGIETVFLFAEHQYEHISSTIVRELLHYNKDISKLVPHPEKVFTL
ncbi:MAG: pantetheine-phosphate adenylyltransferase [Tannerella sp.]|jgi:pantetheine-phosphate adenylyltransferase|nr:pantetheine-phosphate adenylyltransferase [Tannerella sp.]